MPLKNFSRQNKPLGEKLDKLAERIADDLIDNGSVEESMIVGFRALAAYYGMLHKIPPDELEGTKAFNGFKDALANSGGTRARPSGPGVITFSTDDSEFEGDDERE